MMTLQEVKGLQPGDAVRLTCATEGGTAAGTERTYPPGEIGTVLFSETLPGRQGFAVHVQIGEGDQAICNVFDQSDDCSRYPFDNVATGPRLMTTTQTIRNVDLKHNAAELLGLLAEFRAIELMAVHVIDDTGRLFTRARVNVETLSDGSQVTNLILSDD